MGDKVVFDSKGNLFLWKSGDLHTNWGVLKEKDKKDGVVTTHLGNELVCLPASFVDKLEKITRGPAVMTKKDIGIILSNVPLTKKSKVVDAGSGCGVLAAFLANISDNVTSYENHKKHASIAAKNWKLLGVKVKAKTSDIYSGISEKNLDVITLDLQFPEKVLMHAHKSLKKGGFLVTFLPNIGQVSKVIDEARKDFFHVKTVEVIEREWIVEGLRLRPQNTGLLHTGFISIFRKL
jgi:tRNA (adenine57-N1/adenine58-N1)-methyltransferase|tara:strand:- start:11876 stop:12583 length:708 start_codon:yes stop_codon:yes gene_type:complete